MLKPEFNRMKQLINNRPTHAATKSRRASMHMYISVYISTILYENDYVQHVDLVLPDLHVCHQKTEGDVSPV